MTSARQSRASLTQQAPMISTRIVRRVVGLAFLAAAAACSKASEQKPPPAQEPAAKPAFTSSPAATPAAAPAEPAKPAGLPPPPDVAAPPADAKKTANGLASKVIAKGEGSSRPGPRDRVKVNYTGWTTDGKMFDSSVTRGQPAEFPLDRVIKGWTEGLQLMARGEKRRFWIPGNLAYGDTPSRPGAPAGMLVFDVELLDFVKAPEPPETPKDVAEPPKNAKKTSSGLAYRVLKRGTGKEHPTAGSTVQVHYSGWTKDGKMFDSSVIRGEPASFPLGGVIPGWTEGVQLMVVGEKTRFWIPGNLAYGDTPTRPGAPAGMLVFDIELLAIK
jgi:peptidylprolyl isomerase